MKRPQQRDTKSNSFTARPSKPAVLPTHFCSSEICWNKSDSKSSKRALRPCCDHYFIKSYRETVRALTQHRAITLLSLPVTVNPRSESPAAVQFQTAFPYCPGTVPAVPSPCCVLSPSLAHIYLSSETGTFPAVSVAASLGY